MNRRVAPRITAPCYNPAMKRMLLRVVAVLAAQATTEVEITAEPHHHFVFENSYVHVSNVDVAPHAETLMHWHRHDYVYVTLGAVKLSNLVQGKAPTVLNLQDGEVRFSPAPFAHAVRDLSDQPFRNVTIEYMQDANLRAHPAKWDEERGLDILDGGTKEILFVNDGVRATEFELQPGGVVPMHHHAGPHLLVAVTDLDIRSDVSGTGPMSGPMPGHFKSGDSKWLPGGYSHTITNTGKNPAKFVTLEFH
jgi:quercetin dioxygenase-like cupin family protein